MSRFCGDPAVAVEGVGFWEPQANVDADGGLDRLFATAGSA